MLENTLYFFYLFFLTKKRGWKKRLKKRPLFLFLVSLIKKKRRNIFLNIKTKKRLTISYSKKWNKFKKKSLKRKEKLHFSFLFKLFFLRFLCLKTFLFKNVFVLQLFCSSTFLFFNSFVLQLFCWKMPLFFNFFVEKCLCFKMCFFSFLFKDFLYLKKKKKKKNKIKKKKEQINLNLNIKNNIIKQKKNLFFYLLSIFFENLCIPSFFCIFPLFSFLLFLLFFFLCIQQLPCCFFLSFLFNSLFYLKLTDACHTKASNKKNTGIIGNMFTIGSKKA